MTNHFTLSCLTVPSQVPRQSSGARILKNDLEWGCGEVRFDSGESVCVFYWGSASVELVKKGTAVTCPATSWGLHWELEWGHLARLEEVRVTGDSHPEESQAVPCLLGWLRALS